MSIKLDRGNILIEREQMMSLILTYGLESYINGVPTEPLKFLDDSQTMNSEYVTSNRINGILKS